MLHRPLLVRTHPLKPTTGPFKGRQLKRIIFIFLTSPGPVFR